MKTKIWIGAGVLLLLLTLNYYRMQLHDLRVSYKQQQHTIETLSHNMKVIDSVTSRQQQNDHKRKDVSRETETKLSNSCVINDDNANILRKYTDDINHYYSK